MRFGVIAAGDDDEDLAFEVQDSPPKRPGLVKRTRSKNVSRYGVDLDYSSSSSASPSSAYESDSSTDFGSLSEGSAENNDLEKRKKSNWNKSSSKERKRRRQRKLASRLSALLEDATLAGGSSVKPPLGSDGKKKTGKSGKSKGLGKSAKGIGATLDEWDRWEMMSQQQALLAAQKRAASFNLDLQDLAEDNYARTMRRQDTSVEREMDQVMGLLKGLEIKRMEDEKKQLQEFDKRNRALWDTIEQTIKTAEAAEAKLQAEKEEIARKEREIREEQETKRRQAQEEADKKRREAEAAAAAVEKANRKEREAAAAEAAVREEEKRQAVVKAAEERKRKQAEAEAEAAKAKEESDAASLAAKASTSNATGELVMKRNEWRKWREVMATIKEQVIEKVKQDDAIRRGLRRTKNTITMRIGQVVNTRESILKITDDLHQHLCSQLPSRPTPSTPFALSPQLPIPYLYLLSHIAKSMIKQAESEISAKPEAAYPLAKITIGLLLRGHQALNDVLFSRLVKKCCWVVPYFPPKQPEQSEGEYRKSIGQKETAGTEDSVQYNQRMAAILTLYLAICSTDVPTLVDALNEKPTSNAELEALIAPEFRITSCWTWLAMMGKAPLPDLDPSPKLVATAFEMVGQDMIRAFGTRQMRKMTQAYLDDGLGGREAGSGAAEGILGKRNVAARAQLRLLLEPFLYEGKSGFEEKPARQWEV